MADPIVTDPNASMTNSPDWTLSPAEATAELERMAVALRGPAPPPNSPNAAAAALAALENDEAWRSRFLAGDLAAARQRSALQAVAGDEQLQPPDAIEVIDRVSNPGAVQRYGYETLIDGMRESGYLPEGAEQLIRALDRGETVNRPTEGDGAAAAQALDRLAKNPEWTKQALVVGTPESNLRSVLSHIVALSTPDSQPATEFILQTLERLELR